ncbi:uncharacterized protein B0T15DRAFT_516941 [Chaetomium strumarium]|uniref:Secreted protein n=1 Tax=Chaetomium strumarium TaxID=1170767 RepID=A0AAJ0H1R8_9PEZI|nr:hypothetical protein B0T15DRAFT_516941 [Chaetomium strumarium]
MFLHPTLISLPSLFVGAVATLWRACGVGCEQLCLRETDKEGPRYVRHKTRGEPVGTLSVWACCWLRGWGSG